jgi:hypothetical protein
MTRSQIILGILAIGACGAIVYAVVPLHIEDTDVIASLSEPSLSERYSSAFWEKERAGKTSLWTQALEACRDAATTPRPNCQIVLLVAHASAQEELAREQLAERRRLEKWIKNGAKGEIGDGLTGKGAKAGGLPNLKPNDAGR